jgi:hypothetical protein
MAQASKESAAERNPKIACWCAKMGCSLSPVIALPFEFDNDRAKQRPMVDAFE